MTTAPRPTPGTKPSGKIAVAGSSSVSPLMEKLIEAYQALNPGADIELQTSDSTTGMTNAIDGVCDLGMASRELKQEELDAGLVNTVIATDGIAVIVNNDSPIDELTSDQVKPSIPVKPPIGRACLKYSNTDRKGLQRAGFPALRPPFLGRRTIQTYEDDTGRENQRPSARARDAPGISDCRLRFDSLCGADLLLPFSERYPSHCRNRALQFPSGNKMGPSNDKFGIFPMILGSIYVTAGAILVGVPLGLLTAIFLARFCPKRLYRFFEACGRSAGAFLPLYTAFFRADGRRARDANPVRRQRERAFSPLPSC